ncbi:MAG: hypothetical protein FP814_08635 [Desulfobacterium sp.]|nr:hypothetical protein [Desulfobacterium sp.]
MPLAHTPDIKAGLKILAAIDLKKYPTGIKVSDKTMKSLTMEKNDFHGEWNYTVSQNINI